MPARLVSIDAGAIVDGWHGDAARTFYVGEPPAAVAILIETTRAAMLAGIAAAVPGNHIEDISAAVEDVALPHGLAIIRQFVGHGIGTEMHEEPQVPNYRTGRRGRKLEPGLCLAIEPMFTLGDYRAHILADDWTVSTDDGSLAAHFEDFDRGDRPWSRDPDDGLMPMTTLWLLGSATFDTLRVRVSVRPGRHCA